MTTKMRGLPGESDPFPEDELDTYHSPEPWTQDGRYIRDARGAIVVRGRTLTDARRIVAAINATRDIPTDALEGWLVEDVSEPATRPDLEVVLGGASESSPYAVRPPEEAPLAGPVRPAPAPEEASPEWRRGERRCRERRSARSVAAHDLIFDRRVMERRFGDRRQR